MNKSQNQEIFLEFFLAIFYLLTLLGLFTELNDRFPYSFKYFN